MFPQMQEDMEPERGALGLPFNFGAGQRKGGSPESPKHRSTMQEILAEIQSLVERSDVINVSIVSTSFAWNKSLLC